MPKISKDSITERVRTPKRIYTKDELSKFDEIIQKIPQKPYTLSNGEIGLSIDWEEVEVQCGVRIRYETPSPHTRVIITGIRKQTGQKINPYEEFQNKREQFDRWKYGIEKKDESYAQTAEQITATKAFDEW